MKKVLCLTVCLMLILAVVGCAPAAQPAPESAAPAAPEAPAEATAAAAPAAPEAPEKSASAEAPEEGKRPVVGFANIAETAPQHTIIKQSMERAAEAKGYDLVYMNNKLDGQVAVSNADAMLLRGIDVFIEFNVDASVAPTIMEKMNAANVPVIAVDIAHPGAVYFGANNYGVGPIVGEYTGNLSKEKWGGEPDALLVVEDPISGEAVLARTNNIIEGFRKVFPDFPDDKVFYVDGGQDTSTAQQRVADFLSAHPNFEKIAITPAHSTMRLGASAAVETANRQDQCLMVSQGEYDYIEYLQNTPEEPEWELYSASEVYNFKKYGDYCMDIVEKILNGEQLEEEYYPEHYIIDRKNVYTEFPEEFQ